jgi:hypothetical protein
MEQTQNTCKVAIKFRFTVGSGAEIIIPVGEHLKS